MALLSVLSGLLLGLLGGEPLPVTAGLVVAGALLAGAALLEVRRCGRRRRVVRSSVLYTLTAGLVLLDLPLVIEGLGRALAAPLGWGALLWWLAALLSVVLVAVVPVLSLSRVRRRRYRARYRVAGERPRPLVWDFSRPRRVVLAAGVMLAGALALVPLVVGGPPLELAIRAHSPRLTALCLDLGADPNRPGPWGLTPLALAVRRGEPGLVTLLIARGADPNDRRHGDPPLLAAVAAGATTLLGPLLAGGADPNRHGALGFPLTVAARRGDLEGLDLLLAHGAQVDLRDDTGCTALAVAFQAPAQDVPALVEHLLAAGANPDAYCDDGGPQVSGDRVTPLMIAAALGLEPVVSRLLAAGARPHLQSIRGRTAFDLAVEHGRDPVARLLGALGESAPGLARPPDAAPE